MNDSEMLQQALALLAVMERNIDPDRDEIRITRQAWLDLTRPFRQRMESEARRRVAGTVQRPFGSAND